MVWSLWVSLATAAAAFEPPELPFELVPPPELPLLPDTPALPSGLAVPVMASTSSGLSTISNASPFTLCRAATRMRGSVVKSWIT